MEVLLESLPGINASKQHLCTLLLQPGPGFFSYFMAPLCYKHAFWGAIYQPPPLSNQCCSWQVEIDLYDIGITIDRFGTLRCDKLCDLDLGRLALRSALMVLSFTPLLYPCFLNTSFYSPSPTIHSYRFKRNKLPSAVLPDFSEEFTRGWCW